MGPTTIFCLNIISLQNRHESNNNEIFKTSLCRQAYTTTNIIDSKTDQGTKLVSPNINIISFLYNILYSLLLINCS